LRAGRETDFADERARVAVATDALSRQIHELGQWTPEGLRKGGAVDRLRGAEGMGASHYVVFS
jgi:hypothetical protein